MLLLADFHRPPVESYNAPWTLWGGSGQHPETVGEAWQQRYPRAAPASKQQQKGRMVATNSLKEKEPWQEIGRTWGWGWKKRTMSNLSNLCNCLSNQPWLFQLLAHHVASEQVLPLSAPSIFADWIYFIILSSYAQGPPSAQLFVSTFPPAVTFSASHQHILSIPFETIYKGVKEHKCSFLPSTLDIWLLCSILKLDSYKEALKRSNSVNIQFLATLYAAVLILVLCSFCQAILTNEFADIIYGLVNLMCNNIKFILMSRNPSLICVFSQNKNKYRRLWIPNS